MLAFVSGDPPLPTGVDNNGTASFIELPGGKFIVTTTTYGARSKTIGQLIPPTGSCLRAKASLSRSMFQTQGWFRKTGNLISAYCPTRLIGSRTWARNSAI